MLKDFEEISKILLSNDKDKINKVFALKSQAAFFFKKEYISSKDKQFVIWKWAVPAFDGLKEKESRFCKHKDRKQGWWD